MESHLAKEGCEGTAGWRTPGEVHGDVVGRRSRTCGRAVPLTARELGGGGGGVLGQTCPVETSDNDTLCGVRLMSGWLLWSEEQDYWGEGDQGTEKASCWLCRIVLRIVVGKGHVIGPGAAGCSAGVTVTQTRVGGAQ